jgi:predicted RNA polymerase sigma factor
LRKPLRCTSLTGRCAHLLRKAGLEAEAAEAYSIAAGMTEDEAVRRFLLRQREAMLAFGDRP